MKRFVISYSNGLMEQCSAIDRTIERQLTTRVVAWILDTQAGIVIAPNEKGEINQYPVPDVDEPQEKPTLKKAEK